MSDLKPLVDEDRDELLLQILRSADDDVPSDAGRDRALVALGLGAAPLAAGAGAVKVFGLTGWKLIVSVAALVVTLGGGAMLAVSNGAAPTHHDATSSLASPVQAAPVTPPMPMPTPTPTPDEAPVASVAPASSAPSAPSAPVEPSAPTTMRAAPKSGVPAASAALSAKPAAPTALGLELASLDEARSALAARDPATALARLDRHVLAFPRPQLADEATMLRIEALHAKGDLAAARALANRFLATHAGTTYEDRVRSLLGPTQ